MPTHNSIFARFMSMWKKQIISRAIFPFWIPTSLASYNLCNNTSVLGGVPSLIKDSLARGKLGIFWKIKSVKLQSTMKN